MLLIELEGGSTPRYKLEFHPRLTIVAGLDEIQRHELYAGIIASLRGDTGRRMKLQVDIGNTPQVLDYDRVFNLGLNNLEFNNVVTPADLPGYQGPKGRDFNPNDEILSAARRELTAAKQRALEIEELVATLSKPVDRISPEEIREAEAQSRRAHDQVDRLTQQLHDMGASQNDLDPRAEVDRLLALRAQVQGRIEELSSALKGSDQDPAGLAAALAVAEGLQHHIVERSERSLQLAQMGGAWTRITATLSALDRQPKPPEWLIVQTKDELDDIMARVAALTYQQQEGIEVSVPLAKAHQRLSDVKASWEEIENGVAGQTAAAQDKRDELHGAICQFLSRTVDIDQVADALDAEMTAIHNAVHPNAELVNELAALGVESDVDDALIKARIWLEGRSAVEAKRASDKAALAVALADINDIKAKLAEAEVLAAEPRMTESDFDRLRDELNAAKHEAKTYDAQLSMLRDREAQMVTYDPESLPAARNQLQLALSAVEAAERKVDYFARANQPAPDPLSIEAPTLDDSGGDSSLMGGSSALRRPWWEGGQPAGQVITAADVAKSGYELDVYLLARAAAQRMLLPGGESLPLLIDGILAAVTPDVAVKTLEALAKVASVVQIIYLAESDFAEKWAKRQDIRKTAVVRLERA